MTQVSNWVDGVEIVPSAQFGNQRGIDRFGKERINPSFSHFDLRGLLGIVVEPSGITRQV